MHQWLSLLALGITEDSILKTNCYNFLPRPVVSDQSLCTHTVFLVFRMCASEVQRSKGQGLCLLCLSIPTGQEGEEKEWG